VEQDEGNLLLFKYMIEKSTLKKVLLLIEAEIFFGYFRKHCCFSTVHEPNKARVGQITFVRPTTFVRFRSHIA
jgi:hypothetical protein